MKKFKDILYQEKQSSEANNLNTQPATSPQPSTNLQGKKIRMYSLDTTHRQFAIKPDDKFQYQ